MIDSTVPLYHPTEKPSQVINEGDFTGKIWSPLPLSIQERISGKSWNEKCPVPLKDLAYIQVTHWNFKGEMTTGEIVFHKNLAEEITKIFQTLFTEHYPINKLLLVDDYNADDDRSMEDNNSSAFCSRAITGKPGSFSKHSYGGAIDLNPLQNPYVKGKVVLPAGAESYLDRTQDVPGLIKEGDICYKAFTERGYSWGGHWNSLKDYQHFEKDPDTFIEKVDLSW